MQIARNDRRRIAFCTIERVTTTHVAEVHNPFNGSPVGAFCLARANELKQAPSFRVENMPYGGVKDSGEGREGVASAMEEMTEPRALIFNLG